MWNVSSTPAIYQKWIYIRNKFNNSMNNRNFIHRNHLIGNVGLQNPSPWKIASGYWFRRNNSQLTVALRILALLGLIQNTIDLNTRPANRFIETYKIIKTLNNRILVVLSTSTGVQNVHL